MYIAIGIILALVVFTVIVFFHELGHFLAAKASKIKVEEFGIGIPPRAAALFQDKSGTTYTLNWLPIGGFVKLKWESSLDPRAKEDNSFASKSYLAKTAVLLAGVIMNFIFAWVICTTLFAVWVAPLAINSKFATTTQTLLIPSFEQAKDIGLLTTKWVALTPIKDSPADKAGIIANDEVLSIGGANIQSPEEFIAYFKSHPSDLSQIRISRGGKETTINITPKDGKIGSYVGYKTIDLNTNFEYKYPLGQAMLVGAKEVYNQSVLTLELFGSLIRKLVAPVNPGERKEAQESLSGPIGIGNLFVDLAKSHASVSVVLLIAALISINLGVFNLLPFPALDGGRFAFLTIETIVRKLSRGKIRGDKLESTVHAIGFALLILLSIFVAYQDIVRIFFRW